MQGLSERLGSGGILRIKKKGGVIDPGEFKDYEYVDSYHGKVWVGADGMMDERYEIEFQVVLNGLTSNKKSVVIFYRTP